ncbi:MAG: hypothetical protein H7343_18790 [Undibacterium sp.]|nr:hypothetical protein [Opitutaceae bacterium]
MKKLVSLILAVVSTMLLVTGATHAAEKFDPLAEAAKPSATNFSAQAPSAPCIVVEEDPPVSVSL